LKAKRTWLVLLLILGCLALAPAGVLAQEGELTKEQQLLYNEMMKTFVAPDFCGKSLVECPAPITVEMREGIYEQVKNGATKEEIIAYWTGIYGERILAAPPKSGFFLAAWVLPVVGIVVGVVILAAALKGRMGSALPSSRSRKQPIPGEYEEELQQEILKHL